MLIPVRPLTILRKIAQKLPLYKLNDVDLSYITYKDQVASDLIKNKLLDRNPLMVCRFGSVELRCLANYYSIKNHKNNYWKYISGKISPFWWDERTTKTMANNAGFFPPTPRALELYSQLMLEDIKLVDVLGSWLHAEHFFNKELSNSVRVGLGDLHPYNFKDPWSEALKGKKVLVVHPFDESIKNQYLKRELLFKDQRILPDFELKTLKAVQSIANTKTSFKDWFEALDYMKGKISDIDFDIAIIGCGAYGFPLAAHVKRMGKKALHLGGVTQVLFGIIGNRWLQESNHTYVKDNFFNEHWVRPLPSETPQGIDKVEGACYW
jgi:hypothetical protein